MSGDYGWRGPDFTYWWTGHWRERVKVSVEAGVGMPEFGWHWSRIKASFLFEKDPDRAPTEEFLRWVDLTKGLRRFSCGTGTLEYSVDQSHQNRLARLFPELALEQAGRISLQCMLVRLRHHNIRRDAGLLALVPLYGFRPLSEGTGTFRSFLKQLESQGLHVHWGQRLGKIQSLAEIRASYLQEVAL